MRNNTYKRHLAKAFTWRIIGAVDTLILTWIISGDPLVGLQVGVAEVLSKMALYYYHERLWFSREIGNQKTSTDNRKRHLIKTFSWRAVGTLDTMILAWIISGNPLTGVKIAAAEVITKVILYYAHERLWYRTNYGLPFPRRNAKFVENEIDPTLKPKTATK